MLQPAHGRRSLARPGAAFPEPAEPIPQLLIADHEM
jgi:hypothetical protein